MMCDVARRFLPGMMRAFVAMLFVTFAADSALACSVCSGDPASPMTAGMNGAITTLLAITGTVLSTFVGFFLFLWRRARNAKHAEVDTAWIEGLRGAKNV